MRILPIDHLETSGRLVGSPNLQSDAGFASAALHRTPWVLL
jgi:hypothetical protein